MHDYITQLYEFQTNFQSSKSTVMAAMKETGHWGEPEVLTDIAAPSLDPDLLPNAARACVEDICERMSVPIEAALPALLAAISTAIGANVKIQPKELDCEWLVPLSIWGALVAVPGVKKSDVFNSIFRALEEKSKVWLDQYEAELKFWSPKQAAFDEELKALKGKLKQKYTDQNPIIDEQQVQARMMEIEKEVEENAPKLKRLIVGDSTPEAFQETLRNNPNGVLLQFDELARLFETFNKPGYEQYRTLLLECWNSKDKPSFIDRVSTGTKVIKRSSANICGTIQPDVFINKISESNRRIGADGFYNRFQILVAPNFNRPFELKIKSPNLIAKDEYFRLFERLFKLRESGSGQK